MVEVMDGRKVIAGLSFVDEVGGDGDRHAHRCRCLVQDTNVVGGGALVMMADVDPGAVFALDRLDTQSELERARVRGPARSSQDSRAGPLSCCGREVR